MVQSIINHKDRIVREAIIFGGREFRCEHPYGLNSLRGLRHDPQRRLRCWDNCQRILGFKDWSSLRRLKIYHFDPAILARMPLPASIEALAFIDTRGYPAAAQADYEGDLFQNILHNLNKAPESKGLVEFVLVQRADPYARSYDPLRIVDFVHAQPRLAVLCIHQPSRYSSSIRDYALPTLTTFSIRHSQEDVDYAELEQIAKRSPKGKACGFNWSFITIEGHSLRTGFQMQAEALAVGDPEQIPIFGLICSRLRFSR